MESRSKSQQGKYVRQKGSNYERKIARMFRRIYPEAKRHLEVQKDEAKLGVDVYAGNFGIQCKKKKQYAPINAITQIKDDSVTPLLITAGNKLPDMVVIPLTHFIDLITKAEGKV